MIGLKIDQQ